MEVFSHASPWDMVDPRGVEHGTLNHQTLSFLSRNPEADLYSLPGNALTRLAGVVGDDNSFAPPEVKHFLASGLDNEAQSVPPPPTNIL
jgi:hypothetical protein